MSDLLLNIPELRKIQDFLFKRGDSLNNITMHKCSTWLGYGYMFNPLALDEWYAESFKKEWHKDLSLGANLILLWSDDGNLQTGLFYLKEFGLLIKCVLEYETLDDCLKEATNAREKYYICRT